MNSSFPKKITNILICCIAAVLPQQVMGQDDPDKAFSEERLEVIGRLLDGREFERAIREARQFIRRYEDNGNLPDSLVVKAQNLLGSALRENGDYEMAMDSYERSLVLAKKVFGERHLHVADIYVNLCSCCINQGRICQAKSFCGTAQHLFEALDAENNLDFADAIAEMGSTFLMNGDFVTAIDHYQKSLAVYLNHVGPNDPVLAYHYYNIGNAHLENNEPDEALQYLLLALKLDKVTGDPFYIADDLDNIALAYQMKRNYPKALEYFDAAIDLYRQNPELKPDYLAHAYQLKGECYALTGNHDRAVSLYLKALQLLQEHIGEQHIDVAAVYRLLGESYAHKKDFQQALLFYDKATQALLLNPQEELLYEKVSSPAHLLEIMKSRAKCLYEYSHQLGDVALLRTSLTIFLESEKLIDYLRTGYRAKGSKLLLLNETKALFDQAVTTAYELFEIAGDEQYKNLVHHFAEKSRSILLLESLYRTKAEEFAGLPAEHLEKERNLETALTECEKEILDLKQKMAANPDDPSWQESLSEQNERLFDLKQSYYALTKSFEDNYPAYFRAKYSMEVLEVPEIQQSLLREDQALIEYVVGNQVLFAIVITKNDYRIYRLDESFPLHERVVALRTAMMGQQLLHSTASDAQASAFKRALSRYEIVAHQLYEQLLAPLEADGLPPSLVIVPDGVLGYLPFDVLLKNRPDSLELFKDYSFLLKDYQISYNYSGTLWQEMRSQAHDRTSGGLLAVAPSFEEGGKKLEASAAGRNQLGPLFYNVREAEAVRSLLGGRILEGRQATKRNFTALAPQYKILHLSTHGKANDRRGDNSFLAISQLADTPDMEEYLYVRELYNLDLNADLVTLSACETGIGELQSGEGIVSLARGFSYAGAKSIVMTLWSVDDAQTRQLMEYFYGNI